MRAPTITQCTVALQAVASVERDFLALTVGTQWESDPRVLALYEAARVVVDVIRDAHLEAVKAALAERMP